MGAAARHHGYVQFLTRTPDTEFLLFPRLPRRCRIHASGCRVWAGEAIAQRRPEGGLDAGARELDDGKPRKTASAQHAPVL